MIFSLEASDDYGLQGLEDCEDLSSWLKSWLLDSDSTECKLQKLQGFNPDTYLTPQ